jgi:hypothetical protein
VSAVEGPLGQNGRQTDVIPVVLLKIRFDFCIGNRDQASQANGIERTISISSVWKKWWKRENHRAASFLGEVQPYKGCAGIDGQFRTVWGFILKGVL